MKKYVLILLVFSFGFLNDVIAQCSVTNIVITPKVTPPSSGPGCRTFTIDLEFTASTNSGNKRVYFHVWQETEYPLATMNTEYQCNSTDKQSVANIPVRSTTGLPGPSSQVIDVLDNAFINFGFDINTITTTFGTAGIFTNYANYDPSVPLNATGVTIKKVNIATDVDRIFIQNLTFTVPSTFNCGDLLYVRTFTWSTNSSSAKPQCWVCGTTLYLNDPVVSGKVNCTIPRTFDVIIDSKYENPLGTAAPITGTYEAFIDDNRNTIIDAIEETTLKVSGISPVSFTTSTSGAPTGFTSRYTSFGMPYQISLSNGDERSTDPILVRVTVTTPGFNGSTVGILANNCAVLPISLRNFNATQRNGKVALTWETDLENNNDGFDVQRRLGNGRYESIGFVDSKAPAGTGGAYAYSFDDNLSAANTVSYYRLRQVDLDGKSNYSEIKSVRNGAKQIAVSVYPNPSRGTTNVSIPEGSGIMDISLNDLTGKSVQRWNSVNMRSLQLNNLKPGIYMLRINFRESGDQVVERIVVQ